jgi:DNA (cytosine-5)-methyltransferase 1
LVVASRDRASDGHHGYSSGRGDGADNLIAQVADPISANEGKTYTHEGKNNFRTDNVIEVAFYPTGGSQGQSYDADSSPSIKVGSGIGLPSAPAISGSMGVRRLTPRECERLQGWAEDWTRYTADGKEIPDSHRYRMIGNGVVAPVAEWIGYRLVEADAWP